MPGRRIFIAEVLRDVGRRIAELRHTAGLTQAQVSEKLGVSTREYARIESGRANLTLATMVSVADVLGTCLAEMVVRPASQEVKRGRPKRNRD